MIPPDLDDALRTLLTLGLVAPLPSTDADDDAQRYLVHRWTAAALTGHTDPDGMVAAHRRAAQFWRWRVGHSLHHQCSRDIS